MAKKKKRIELIREYQRIADPAHTTANGLYGWLMDEIGMKDKKAYALAELAVEAGYLDWIPDDE